MDQDRPRIGVDQLSARMLVLVDEVAVRQVPRHTADRPLDVLVVVAVLTLSEHGISGDSPCHLPARSRLRELVGCRDAVEPSDAGYRQSPRGSHHS